VFGSIDIMVIFKKTSLKKYRIALTNLRIEIEVFQFRSYNFMTYLIYYETKINKKHNVLEALFSILLE